MDRLVLSYRWERPSEFTNTNVHKKFTKLFSRTCAYGQLREIFLPYSSAEIVQKHNNHVRGFDDLPAIWYNINIKPQNASISKRGAA